MYIWKSIHKKERFLGGCKSRIHFQNNEFVRNVLLKELLLGEEFQNCQNLATLQNAEKKFICRIRGMMKQLLPPQKCML